MNYLLDTHAFLWYVDGNLMLPLKIRQVIQNPETAKFLSIVSLWEISN